MKIGIDTFGLDHGNSGIGSYLLSLLKSFPDTGDAQIELFGPETDHYTYSSNRAFEYNGISIKDNFSAERKWHAKKAAKFCKKNGYDVTIFTDGTRLVPAKPGTVSIAVVSSILSSHLAECGYFERKHIIKGLSNMDCIIASSNFIKKDLRRCGIRCPRVEIVHYGIDHKEFFPVFSENTSGFADIKPFAIKKPYIIYASRMQGPEKKHVELIRAFDMFKKKTGLPHRLVLAGEAGSYFEEVQKEAFNASCASDIFMTGFFPRKGYPELYRNAELCVFPSVNEGVGLPVLEAMAVGVPVACAKAGSLQEFGNQSAVYFDSDSIEEMAQVMEKLITDEALRKKLIESGMEWSKRFSWEETALQTVKIVKDVYKAASMK